LNDYFYYINGALRYLLLVWIHSMNKT